MSKFAAIWAVSKTLQLLLENEIKTDPQFAGGPPVPVSLLSPKAIREPSSTAPSSSIAVWLYRVARNEFTLNNRPDRAAPNQVPHLSIPIDLYYLITPMYEREGVCNLFPFPEPTLGWCHVEVNRRRTKRDFATAMKDLVDVHFPNAPKIRVVLDNLNIHTPASLYETFEPEERLHSLSLPFTSMNRRFLNQKWLGKAHE